MIALCSALSARGDERREGLRGRGGPLARPAGLSSLRSRGALLSSPVRAAESVAGSRRGSDRLAHRVSPPMSTHPELTGRLCSVLQGVDVTVDCLCVDLDDDAAPDRIVSAAVQRFGAIHVLVNNACPSTGACRCSTWTSRRGIGSRGSICTSVLPLSARRARDDRPGSREWMAPSSFNAGSALNRSRCTDRPRRVSAS